MSTAFQVILTGDQEVTSPIPGGTGSKASGLGTVVFDSDALTASYSFRIEGLDFGEVTIGLPLTPQPGDDVTRVHFHNQESGVNGGIVFGQISPADDENDLSIVLNKDHSWTVSGVWDTTDGAVAPGSASITNASTIPPFLTFDTILGTATVGTEVPLYFNVHTDEFGAGEIRGQLVAIADDFQNTVEGTAGHDWLPGLGGNDTILGFEGDDRLEGGDGDDTMDGGKGADILVGGAGNDSLTGGQGPDLYEFNAGFGMDTVTDFKVSQDQIQLFQAPQSVEQDGDDTVITVGTNTITLLGVQASSLPDDFLM